MYSPPALVWRRQCTLAIASSLRAHRGFGSRTALFTSTCRRPLASLSGMPVCYPTNLRSPISSSKFPGHRPILFGVTRWMLPKNSRPYASTRDPYVIYEQQIENNSKFIWAIIGANFVVFIAWQFIRVQYVQKRPVVATNMGSRHVEPGWVSSLRTNLEKYFIFKLSDMPNGNYLSSLGCAFSHIDPVHFIVNMINLYAFSGPLIHTPGIKVGHVAWLVFGSAFFGSAGYYVYESQRQQYGIDKAALGASGVVMGVGTAAAIVAPNSMFKFMYIIPVPIWVLVPGYLLIDLLYLDDASSKTAHSGHLGGAAFGMALAVLRLRGAPGRFYRSH